MPDSYSRKQVVFTHGQMVQVLDEMVRKNFSEWSQNLDGRYLKRLEQPLMVRCKDKTAKLDVNFDAWVTQTQLTHKTFTLKYTFMQGLTLYTGICVQKCCRNETIPHKDTNTCVRDTCSRHAHYLFCIFLCVLLSRNLLNLFSEIHYWDRLKFEIPQCVSDIFQDREDLRGLRERALLLIRDYNRSDIHTHTHTHTRGERTCVQY